MFCGLETTSVAEGEAEEDMVVEGPQNTMFSEEISQ